LWLNGAPFLAATARIFSRIGRSDSVVGFMSYILPAIEQGYAWTNNYNRMVCDAAEALWYAERPSHIAVLEDALREKVVKPDFRYPLHDGRLSLARICALTKRYDEATSFFEASRLVLTQQNSEPMLAICDFDEALMYARRDDRERAQPLLAAAVARFERLGMTGWVRRAGGI
jgi:tetratricopeptide (TPR) repeat protein